ncbi:MAG TPA: amidohydrolase family protein [Blastocatellia bacterium]|jgi:imidazolonepropionase-like amidohydrolase|nr:amidohydrolase family protein [Blastocatellia bacterium]
MNRNRTFRFVVKAVIGIIVFFIVMTLGRPIIKKIFHNSVVSAQQAANVFVIRNAKIVTVTGAVIERGSVLIRDGKIAEVGARVSSAGAAKVIDATGLSVYPGMIDSGTQLGLTEIGSIQETHDTTELGDFNPHMRAIVAVQPNSELIPVARANGITTAITHPSGRLVSGQAALINLDGWTWQEMTVKAPAAMWMEYPRAPRGRGAGFVQAEGAANVAQLRERQLTALRQKLEDAQAYAKAKEARAVDKSLPSRPMDFVLDALVPVVKGELPVLMLANTEREIKGAIEIADKYKIKLIISGGEDAWKVASTLKEKNIPVIIGPVTDLPNNEDDDYDVNYSHAAKLNKAGVKFAFQSADAAYVRNLPYQAGTSAAFGLPKDEALKAVTIYPAQIFGVDKMLGSIEVGKMANLIVTDGDPLEFKTNVKHMFINGKPVDLSTRHTRLYDKFKDRQ